MDPMIPLEITQGLAEAIFYWAAALGTVASFLWNLRA
jgi:hypothetical protein